MKQYIGIILLVIAILGWNDRASAQAVAQVVSSCGNPPTTYTVGTVKPVTMDTTGDLCVAGGGGAMNGTNGLPKFGNAVPQAPPPPLETPLFLAMP